MKILLLGATGRTGEHILNELLINQYSVRVLVRDSVKVKASQTNLDVLIGDVSNPSDLIRAAAGCSAIISALNISRMSDFPWSKLRTPINFLSNTMQAI